MYVRELANSGDEARLREVFDDLLGPSKAGSQAQQQDGGWQPQVGSFGPALRAQHGTRLLRCWTCHCCASPAAAVAVRLCFACCFLGWNHPHAAVEYSRLQVLERADALVPVPSAAAQRCQCKCGMLAPSPLATVAPLAQGSRPLCISHTALWFVQSACAAAELIPPLFCHARCWALTSAPS